MSARSERLSQNFSETAGPMSTHGAVTDEKDPSVSKMRFAEVTPKVTSEPLASAGNLSKDAIPQKRGEG